MTLTQSIANILEGASQITVPEKAAGVVPKSVKAKEGLLTFFPLPSPGSDFAVTAVTTQYQFDIWHERMYQAEKYRDQVVNYFNGLAGRQDGRSLIFNVDSDLGGNYEENGDIWHYVVIINVNHNRLVS